MGKFIGKVSNYLIDSLKLIFISFATVYIYGELAIIIKNMEIHEPSKIITSTILAIGSVLIIFDEVLKISGHKRGK
jgi:hypothetical protein